MIAQVCYHYKEIRLPEDMTWSEFITVYQDLVWVRDQEAKHNDNNQLVTLLGKLFKKK